jgi:hypothetical protein
MKRSEWLCTIYSTTETSLDPSGLTRYHGHLEFFREMPGIIDKLNRRGYTITEALTPDKCKLEVNVYGIIRQKMPLSELEEIARGAGFRVCANEDAVDYDK